MRRAACTFLTVGLLLGCAGTRRAPDALPGRGTDHPSPCSTKSEPEPPALQRLTLDEPEWGARIERLEIVGAPHVPRALLTRDLASRPGRALDETALANDTRRLALLEAFADVQTEVEPTPGGVRVRFLLRERERVGRVELVSAPDAPDGEYLPLASGELYDEARLSRLTKGLEARLRLRGHLDARVSTSTLRQSGRVDVCVRAEPGPRFSIGSLEITGNSELSDAELVALIDDRQGRVNRRGAAYRADLLERDLLLMTARYYDRGFVDVRVDAPRVRRDDARHELRVEIPIREGARYRVGRVRFEGRLARSFRGLEQLLNVSPGSVFNRSALAEGMERVRAHFEKRGLRVTVTPSTTIDQTRRVVDLGIGVEKLE